METNGDDRPNQSRETMLTVMLTGLGAAGFLVFLILISSGIFLYVILIVAAITGVGYFHYILWGYSMTQEVEEEQAQEAANRHEPAKTNWRGNGAGHKRF